MKISELVRLTGVSKETIHYYIREGLLRKPRKTGKNSADYNTGYVDRIQTIKSLRENFFLPIPVIRKLFKIHKKLSGSDRSTFDLRSKYFRPLEQLLSKKIEGREAFVKETGIEGKWLEKMEKWKVITAEEDNGRKLYCQDDLIIARLIVDMDKSGIGPRDGFDPEKLRKLTTIFRGLAKKNVNQYMETSGKNMGHEELIEKGGRATEILSLFFYHIYRKLVKEEYKNYLNRLKKENL